MVKYVIPMLSINVPTLMISISLKFKCIAQFYTFNNNNNTYFINS